MRVHASSSPKSYPILLFARLLYSMMATTACTRRLCAHARVLITQILSLLIVRTPAVQYDGYDSLHKLGDGLKGRVRVQFIDEHGEPEAGVVSACFML